MKRTPLSQRSLPNYSRGEEITNTVTHIAGGIIAVAILVICIVFSALHHNVYGIVTSAIYGTTMVALYTVSSVYHGMVPGIGKKIMQVIDHCTIYFLIGGTYTVLLLTAIRPVYPVVAWSTFAFEWTMVIIATVFTAIDLEEYKVFSMICYIGMGWAILPFARHTMQTLTLPGFLLLLSGGIAYTIGAVLYGLGSKRKWMHCIFHVFVILGSVLQFFSVLFYAI